MPFVGSPTDALQIQDGGWPPSWKKSKNCYISAAIRAILTRCGTQMQFSLLTVPTVKNLKFQKKIPDGGGSHFEKSKTDISPPGFERLRQNLA